MNLAHTGTDIASSARMFARRDRWLTKPRFLFPVALWALAVGLLIGFHHGSILNWDEVDYTMAARLGPVANSYELGSLTPFQYAKLAIAKMRGTEPTLPSTYDETQDPLVLRHHHPPFVALLLSSVAHARSERIIRSVQLAGALAFICAILLSYRSISNTISWTGTLIVSLLALWMIGPLFGSLQFHGWEAVWITATAACLAQWLRRDSIPRPWPLSLSLAFALLTLETGLLVWAAALICLFVWKRNDSGKANNRISWDGLLTVAIITLGTVMLIWPGSVLKASLLKIPCFYLYRLMLGAEYSMNRISGVHLSDLFLALWPLLSMSILMGLWLFVAHRNDIRRWGPFVIIGALYGILLTRFALKPHYLLPAFAPLACVIGTATDRLSPLARKIVVPLTMAAIIISWPPWPVADVDQRAREDLSWLRQSLLAKEAMIDGGHIYQYYLGPKYDIQPISVSYGHSSLSVRKEGEYRKLHAKDLLGKVVVLQSNRRDFFDSAAERELLHGCWKSRRTTVVVYDCTNEAVDRFPHHTPWVNKSPKSFFLSLSPGL